jgi:hypothetical protein
MGYNGCLFVRLFYTYNSHTIGEPYLKANKEHGKSHALPYIIIKGNGVMNNV